MVPTSRVFCFVERDPRNIATTHLILHISIMCRSGRHRAEKQTKLKKCFVSLLHNLSTQLHVITICAELLILFKSSWMTKLSNWSTQVVLLNKQDQHQWQTFFKKTDENCLKTSPDFLPILLSYIILALKRCTFSEAWLKCWVSKAISTKNIQKHGKTMSKRQSWKAPPLLCTADVYWCPWSKEQAVHKHQPTGWPFGFHLHGSTLWSFSVISSVEIVELESIWKDPRNKITSASLIFLRDGYPCVASNKRFLDCARASSVTCGSVGWGSLFVGVRLWYLAKYHLHPAQALAWYFLTFSDTFNTRKKHLDRLGTPCKIQW